MKVLLLHQHFNTPYAGGAIRSYYLAKALVDAGHEVVVLTGSNEKDYSQAVVDGIEVYYIPVPYNNNFGFYKRSVSFIRYVRKVISLSEKFKDADVCYAISVPLTVGVAAMRIKKMYGIPFIFEVGDLWPDAPVEMGFIKNPLLKRILFSLEKKIYQSAESVVALSTSIKSAIESKCPEKKVHLIPNMADTEFFETARSGEDKRFTISYIGSLGLANGLMHFLDCAKASLDANLPVRFVICGDGAVRQQILHKISSAELVNVTLAPFTNRHGVKKILESSDAVFISYLPYKILETGSPNKYFDGLAAGKMIITNFGGWIRREIEEHHLGFSVDQNNTNQFVEKLKLFLENPDKIEIVQKDSRALAEKSYSRKILSAAFVKIFDGLKR